MLIEVQFFYYFCGMEQFKKLISEREILMSELKEASESIKIPIGKSMSDIHIDALQKVIFTSLAQINSSLNKSDVNIEIMTLENAYLKFVLSEMNSLR